MNWRIPLMLPISGLAYLAGVNAIVNASRVGAPDVALSLRPLDGGALAARANVQWAQAAQTGKLLDQTKAAQAALKDSPLLPAALRLIGYEADRASNRSLPEKLNFLAARVSRRESGAQFWLMEAAVARNDVKAVLSHYDVLLRTNSGAREQLFQLLATGLSDPEIRDAFVPYVRKAPNWLIGFVDFAAGSSPAPDALSYALRQAGGLPKTDYARNVESGLLIQLLSKQKFAEARAFYLTLQGAKGQVTVSSAFSASGTEPRFAPMTWQLERGANIGAVLAGSEKAHELRVFAMSGESGLAAHKYLYLNPGSYSFAPRYKVTVNSANARASWAIRCMTSAEAPMIYQYDMIRSARAVAPAGNFTVPSNCPVQRLDLNLAGGDDTGGLEMAISQAAIGR
jgi:hypothetical protein